MIQVTFCSKQLFEKKNEVDVSLRLPADAETMKRYLEAAGVRDMDDLLISDFRIHELYAWSCGEYQEWDKADLNELNYLAARLEELLEEEQDEMYDALLCMHAYTIKHHTSHPVLPQAIPQVLLPDSSAHSDQLCPIPDTLHSSMRRAHGF